MKKRRIPKRVQKKLDAIPVSDGEIEEAKALIEKARQEGWVVQLSDESWMLTPKGRRLIEVVPKPSMWFGTLEEQLALLLMATNNEFLFEE